MSDMPPPIDYDQMQPPMDTFYEPDEGYYEAFEYDPFPTLDDTDAPVHLSQPPPVELPDGNMDDWNWHETRLIGVERENQANAYEIGAIDLYTNPTTGDLGGSYLPIADFADSVSAIEYFHELQAEMDEQAIPVYAVAEFAQDKAFERQPEPANWDSATPQEYTSYEYMRDLGLFDADDPPDSALESLLQTAKELGGVLELELENDTAFQALQRIGIDSHDFNFSDNPPPYHDEETGTAYWIGIFQPDKDDPDNCVTSILSLGQNPETGHMEAQLAPCVPGDWDKTYSMAEYLIGIAERGDIEQVFDTAEGMALATDQRNLWEVERGLPLSSESTSDIANLAELDGEIDL
jgi:hypothetical protein